MHSNLASWAFRAAPRFWNAYSEDRRRLVLPAPFTPNPRDWPDRGLHAAWLGHATVLLKIDGATILTDPMFSAGAGIAVGPVTLAITRLVAPALEIRALPPTHVI